ncbi:hypothetical protein GX411_09400 [Candidatus Fermentibacteria bacterium]|nr:hypothetical protein [Candidatus Fermentibacteria bacterium]
MGRTAEAIGFFLLPMLLPGCSTDVSERNVWNRTHDGPILRICPPPGYYLEGAQWSNGVPFKSLFRPDSIPLWEQTRGVIDCISGFDSPLRLCPGWEDPFEENMMRGVFDSLEAWGIDFAVETTCLHELYPTGRAAFDHFSEHWRILESWGADIIQFTMDEPFRRMDELEDPPGIEYAAREVAIYIHLVRSEFGGRVVLMEPYPYFSGEEIREMILLLNGELAELGESGLDGFTLDPDWRLFDRGVGSWIGVRGVEEFCRGEGIPFGLVYWASEAGNCDPPIWDGGRDSMWRDEVMEQGMEYRNAGGMPDEYVIMSWLWIPRAIADEYELCSFTRTVLDFCHAFVRGRM